MGGEGGREHGLTTSGENARTEDACVLRAVALNDNPS